VHLVVVLDELDRLYSVNRAVGDQVLRFLVDAVCQAFPSVTPSWRSGKLVAADHLAPPERSVAETPSKSWDAHLIRPINDEELKAYLELVFEHLPESEPQPKRPVNNVALYQATAGHLVLINYLMYNRMLLLETCGWKQGVRIDRLQRTAVENSSQSAIDSVIKWIVGDVETHYREEVAAKINSVSTARLSQEEVAVLRGLSKGQQPLRGKEQCTSLLVAKGLVEKTTEGRYQLPSGYTGQLIQRFLSSRAGAQSQSSTQNKSTRRRSQP
jgi:hypothetical protein